MTLAHPEKWLFNLSGPLRGATRRPSSPRALHPSFEPLYHERVHYIAFFISLSLSITASGVDLPVAFLQPRVNALSEGKNGLIRT